ncbi:MAG: lysylphosphatidylglycerol synthase transmembrane domain-containing protein [Candidatus Theseobacter exili]|nr:lysylphosphatidylglycerol synthase transmembrane domain-containing protein [Candidatus Theseobacter exili]
MKKPKKDFFIKVLFSVFGIAIAVFLLKQIDMKKFFSFIENVSLKWLLAALAVYSISYLLRSFRWKLMIFSRKIKLGNLFLVTSVHTMFNNILPARAGEVSYVYFLKKFQNISVTEGLATLFVARIFDLVALAVFFLLAVLFSWAQINVPVIKLILITVFSVPVIVFCCLGLFSRRSIRVFRNYIEKKNIGKLPLVIKILIKLEELSEAILIVRTRKTFLPSFLCTLGIWGVKFTSFFLVVKSLNLSDDFRFWNVVFGSTFSELTTILPIHSVAGIGTLEGGWTVGFLLLGMNKQLVIMSGFGFHIFLLLFSIILGSFSLAFLKKAQKNSFLFKEEQNQQ